MLKNRPRPNPFAVLLKGHKVCKHSGKPFKSTLKVNTIAGLTVNSNTNLAAFTFVEDDSIVDVRQCKLISEST